MQAKILNAEHPDYNRGAMDRRHALYAGGGETRKIMTTLLPRMSMEPDKRWADRINRAGYTNYAGPIVDFEGSYVFSHPPVVDVEGPASTWYAGDDSTPEPGFLDNVDRRRTDWTGFWRSRLKDACVNRCAYTMVGLPARGDLDPQNRAEQDAAGLRNAYLVGLAPEDVIDWEDDEAGALSWVMIRHELNRRPSPTEARKKTIRWTSVDATAITVWEWTEQEGRTEPRDDEEVGEVSRTEHGLGELPVVRFRLPVGYWLMEQLHDPAMKAFYAENDFEWAAYQTAHAVMWIRSKWEKDVPPTIGDGYYLQLQRDKDGDDEAGWLEISGSSHEVLLKRVTAARQEIYRVANQLALAGDQNAAEASRSGESKAMDYQAVAIVAAEFGALLLTSMRTVIRMVSKARDDKANPKVDGLEGYSAIDVGDFVDAVAMAKPLVKSETFAKEAAKKVVHLTLGDTIEKPILDTIHTEIDEADYSAETVAPYTPPPLPKDDEDTEDDDTDDGGQ